MSQTKRQSLLEAGTNIAVGYGVNMAANFALFPLFGWDITIAENVTLGVLYTAISLVRSYTLRRIYNRLHR